MKTPILSRASRKSKRPFRPTRPGVEALEGRQVLSTGLVIISPGTMAIYHSPGPINISCPPNPC
jgi:hypothetical protein